MHSVSHFELLVRDRPSFCSSPDTNFLYDLDKYLAQFIRIFEDKQNISIDVELLSFGKKDTSLCWAGEKKIY